jgi:hypothetical protein
LPPILFVFAATCWGNSELHVTRRNFVLGKYVRWSACFVTTETNLWKTTIIKNLLYLLFPHLYFKVFLVDNSVTKLEMAFMVYACAVGVFVVFNYNFSDFTFFKLLQSFSRFKVVVRIRLFIYFLMQGNCANYLFIHTHVCWFNVFCVRFEAYVD